MAAISQIRQESLEKSILFMQQDHANTLKGLHEEIQKLQKRCSGNFSEKRYGGPTLYSKYTLFERIERSQVIG